MAGHCFGLRLIGLLIVAMAFLEGAIATDYVVGDDMVFNWTGNHTAAQVRHQADFDNCNQNAADISLIAESGVRYL
ncbi:Detected protein of unknown function [Hibiscus syriacus]|uniref:Phytocyanin domain-containing protein n=1 Tax=Hibiscus syriacus TaxID=106335 RepID=A0A6A3BBL5_HIBSY|nr:Detected protein of unknown function [Hibiscus syriacus]